MDSRHNAIEFANIVALNPADSTLIGGAVSSEAGVFYIDQAIEGETVLQVSYLGYITKQITLTLNANNNKPIDIGEIVLHEDENLLGEVEVRAFLPPFSREGNSLTANVELSLLKSVGTAVDVIKRFPGISVKDKAITVFGKGSPIIYINNRKVYDENELNRLQSSEIATVELLVSPGAKYDAEGRSVLLIKTKRNEENGLAIRLQEQLSYSKYAGAQEDIALTYTYNNLSLFASYNNLYFKRSRNPHSLYTVYADTVWTQFQDLPQVYKYNTNQVTAGMDWSVSAKHAVGAQYRGMFSSDRVTSSGVNDVLADEVLHDRISTRLYSKAKPYQHIVNAFYKGEYSPAFGLQLDMDYMKSHNKTNQQIIEGSSIEDRNVTLLSQSDFELYAAKLTMEHQLGKGGKLEYGGEYSRVDGSGFLTNPEQYIQSNNYTNEEEKAAGFVVYSNQFGKWSLQVGLRYEYVHALSTEDSTRYVIADRNYHGVYPDISLSGEVGNMQMGLSLSRKTVRPSFDMLNSNNYYTNRFLTQKGNPYLKNEDIYQVDYYLAYKSFDLTAGYIYKEDPISFSLENIENSSSQTIMTYANYSRYHEINALFNYRFEYRIWQSQLSAGIRQPFFKINYMGTGIKRNLTSFNVGFYNDLLLPEGFVLSVNYDYQSKNNNYAWKHNGYHNLDLGLRKSFLDNRLSVNLQGVDVFKWVADRTELKVNDISYIQESTFESRYIILTINYQFNNYKKRYRGQNAAKDEINRL